MGSRVPLGVFAVFGLFLASPASAQPLDLKRLSALGSELGINKRCFSRMVDAMARSHAEELKRAELMDPGFDLRAYARTLAEFGEEARFDRKPGFFDEHQAAIDAGLKTERDAYRELQILLFKKGGTGWTFSLVPRELFRKTGMLRNAVMRGVYKLTDLDFGAKPAFLGELDRLAEGGSEAAAAGFMRRLAENVDRKEKQLELFAKGKKREYERPGEKTLQALCLQRGILSVRACAQALGRFLDWMDPLDVHVPLGKETVSQKVTMRAQIAAFVKDLTNLRAVDRLASRMWDWVADPKALPDTDVFTALKREYLALGVSEPEAVARAWEFFGIYASRGANIGETVAFFTGKAGAGVPGAFAIVAHGMGVLDSRAQAQGTRMFSYPPGVSTTMDNSKPYHFWMSAYLARKGAEMTGSPQAGRNAAWIAQLGYQMRSKTDGRDPSRAFANGAFDTPNNRIRVDLAFAAAGATYGSRSFGPGEIKLDVNEGFRHLVRRGRAVEALPPEAAGEPWDGLGAEGYLRWQRIFNPDSLLGFYDP